MTRDLIIAVVSLGLGALAHAGRVWRASRCDRERLILVALRTPLSGEATGAELVRNTGIGRDVIYPTLQRMEERGLVVHRGEVLVVGEEIERWTRVYRLTDAGREAASCL